jgi:hypothetical protein
MVEADMKAYLVEIDEGLTVAFLDDDDDPEMWFIESRRAEWADQYADSGVPTAAWLENGFTYSCFNCEHPLSLQDGYCDRCSGEQDEDELNERNAGIVFAGDAVYCGEGCKQAHDEAIVRRQAAKNACAAALVEKFPWVKVEQTWIGSPGQCKCFNSDSNNAASEFSFAGSKINHNSYCNGCKKVWVCRGDLEAFRKMVATK